MTLTPLYDSRDSCRPQGFTLLELLVALAIAALLLGLAMPGFSRGLSNVQLRTATRELASALRTAAVQAVVRGEPTALILDFEARRYRVGENGQPHELPSDLELSLVPPSGERPGSNQGPIRFYPDGSSTGGEIELRNQRLAYRVSVEWITGRVKIAEAHEL